MGIPELGRVAVWDAFTREEQPALVKSPLMSRGPFSAHCSFFWAHLYPRTTNPTQGDWPAATAGVGVT